MHRNDAIIKSQAKNCQMNIFTFPLNPLLGKGDLSLRSIKQLYNKWADFLIFNLSLKNTLFGAKLNIFFDIIATGAKQN